MDNQNNFQTGQIPNSPPNVSIPPTQGQYAQPAQPVAGDNNENATPEEPNSTQNSLEIAELREGMVVMRDGSFRAVIACKSINYDLMSSRERSGVEYSYQNFLNSLHFPIQILIRSQRVDIAPYIDKLDKIRRNQDNMLLGVLMDDYINFIDILSQEANIMDKSFFIVIPFSPAGDLTTVKDSTKGFFSRVFSNKTTQVTKINKATWDKARDEVKNRVDAVTGGLFQMGIKSVQLNTKELGELYYNVYNPDTAIREPLGDFEDITTAFTMKGEKPDERLANRGGING